MRDLLFKEGSFRWNRLENLLRNATSSDDYDISQVLNQALEFLFSQRGDYIRDRIVDELVNSVDLWSRNTLTNARAVVSEWLGIKKPKPTVAVAAKNDQQQKSVEHIQRIWEILESTPGFDRMELLQMLPNLLAKPEMQKMGQQVAGGLTQRAIARIIRQIVEAQESKPAPAGTKGHIPNSQPQLSLPAASIFRK